MLEGSLVRIDYSRLDHRRVLSVQPRDVRRYLRANGWQRVDGGAGAVAIFRRDPHDLPEVVVPVSGADDKFFIRRMTEAIWDIAEFEGRSQGQVLANLLAGRADRVQFRVAGPSTVTGEIPIEEGLGLFGGAQKVLLSAACHVVEPQSSFYPRLRRSQANEYVDSCRIAADEGSFIARLVCPLEHEELDDGPEQMELNGDPVPFGRKVVESIFEAISKLVRCTDGDRWTELEEWAEEGPLSANLCDGLLDMQPRHRQSALDISANWSPVRPMTADIPPRVILSGEHFEVVEFLANQLRPPETRSAAIFEGTVEQLSGAPNANGQMEGQVRLRIRDDETIRTARVDLDATDYATALEAHGQNLSVRIRGTLHRKARLSVFTDYEGFEVNVE